MGKGKLYDADADYKQKVEEYRAEWESAMAARIAEKEKGEELAMDTDESLLEGHVHSYFHRTSPMFRPMEQNAKSDNFALPPAAQEDDSTVSFNEKSEKST